MKFLSMGGYAFYVWSAYGIGLAILVGNVLCSRKSRKKTLAKLREKTIRE